MKKRQKQHPGSSLPVKHAGPGKKGSPRSAAAHLACLAVFLVCIFISVYVNRNASYAPGNGIPAEDGWIIESTGEETDTQHFPLGSLSISKTIEGLYSPGQALCLKSIDTNFDVYADGNHFDRAVSIIKEVSGTQLAPDVVDAFLRLVEKGEFRASDDHGGGSMENIENIRAAFSAGQKHGGKSYDKR